MKFKNILVGIGVIVLFFTVINLLPKTGGTYYEFENYKKTIDSSISATVKRIVEGKNFFGAQFGLDSNNYFRFSYQVERTPKQWLMEYPKDFIIMGDSVFKKADSDTFFVERNLKFWKYILPKDSPLSK